MSDHQTVIVESWQSDAMPAPAFNAYHTECFKGSQKPNSRTREVSELAIVQDTPCCGCEQKIHPSRKAGQSQ